MKMPGVIEDDVGRAVGGVALERWMTIDEGREAKTVACLASGVRDQGEVCLPAAVLAVAATTRHRLERLRRLVEELTDRTEYGCFSTDGGERELSTDPRQDHGRLRVGVQGVVSHPVTDKALAAFELGVVALDGGREPLRRTAVKRRVATLTLLEVAVWSTHRTRYQPPRLSSAQRQEEEAEGRHNEIPDGEGNAPARRTDRDTRQHRSTAAPVRIRPVLAGSARTRWSGALPAASLENWPALGLGSAPPLRIGPTTAPSAVCRVSADPVEGGSFVAAGAVIEVLKPTAHEGPPEKARTSTMCTAMSRTAA
jgi:hypothetical protein